MVKFRFITGKSSTYFELNSIDTSARSVFNCGASAVTSTCSVAEPTWNCPSTRDPASAETWMFLYWMLLKPEPSIRTL